MSPVSNKKRHANDDDDDDDDKWESVAHRQLTDSASGGGDWSKWIFVGMIASVTASIFGVRYRSFGQPDIARASSYIFTNQAPCAALTLRRPIPHHKLKYNDQLRRVAADAVRGAKRK